MFNSGGFNRQPFNTRVGSSGTPVSHPHIASRLALKKFVLPIDYDNTVFLAHYDIDASDINGLAPNAGGVYTLRPDGKYGGCVAIEEDTSNVSLMDGQNGTTPWYGDGSPAVTIMDPIVTFRGRKVAKFKTGTSGNCYINSSSDLSTATTSTTWTSSCYIKRVDEKPITSLSGYLYISSVANSNGTATITPVENGWYRVAYSRTVATAGYPTLAGFYGMGTSVDYYFADWQVEPKAFATSFVKGTRAQGLLYYNSPIKDNFTISFWAKAQPYISYAPLIDISTGDQTGTTPNEFCIDAVSGSNTRFYCYNSDASTSLINGPAFPTNEWHHIAVTRDSQNLTAYMDGQVGNTISTVGTSIDLSNCTVRIGTRLYQGSSRYMSSILIDELRIDKVARQPEEILAWYISSSPFYPRGNQRLILG